MIPKSLPFKIHYLAAASFIAILGFVHAQQPIVSQDVENTLRRFLAAMSARDTTELRSVLHSQVSISKAGHDKANIAFLNVRTGSEFLPPFGNKDWDKDKITLTSVKVNISATHPSVAMVSFALDFRLADKEVDGLKTALKNTPAEFSEQQAKEIQQRISNRAVKNAMFAMLAKQSGEWRIVSISLPQ